MSVRERNIKLLLEAVTYMATIGYSQIYIVIIQNIVIITIDIVM